MSSPTARDLDAARRVLRYLQGTHNDGDDVIHMSGYCDSDWGGDMSDRKSTTGYGAFINKNLISWNTKKQPTVALSTAEAELMAIVEAIKEVSWMYQLLRELSHDVVLPINVYIDNQSAS